MRLLTAEQMRSEETRHIAAGRVTGQELMDRAGEGVASEIDRRWGRDAARSSGDDNRTPDALVLCGPGNNGGDGFVAARYLAARGWAVRVATDADPGRLPQDSAYHFRRWSRAGPVTAISGLGQGSTDGEPRDGNRTAMSAIRQGRTVVVDALFGTGLNRPLHPSLVAGLDECRRLKPLAMVAVDMPSGICSDSGRRLNPVPVFDLTVTFHAAKRGHFLADGGVCCGEVVVADIGLPVTHGIEGSVSSHDVSCASGTLRIATPGALGLVKILDKTSPGHKYSHGHGLFLGGPPGRGGAARLAARGALRVGAGLVTLACPVGARLENAARLDAVMLRDFTSDEDLITILADERITALCAGPGLGLDTRARRQIHLFLSTGRPMVLDADALTVWAPDPARLLSRLHAGVVLTPHTGEFARLFPDIAGRLAETPQTWPAFSKVDAAVLAAETAGCTVVLKGADTVVAAPRQTPWLNAAFHNHAVPWLATAGSGDVLAGIITGLLARGVSPLKAAAAAVWLHAKAARSLGPGMISEDLSEALPAVFREVGVGGRE
ncbi:MAG: NAD(P)H-hydrate dehydratase [Paracoccaceae bacterium]|nr:NAD(P)H-hydrate dehydratase [Paracoccaceae bacterium]